MEINEATTIVNDFLNARKPIYELDANCEHRRFYEALIVVLNDSKKWDKILDKLDYAYEGALCDFEQYAEEAGLTAKDDWFHMGISKAIDIIKEERCQI